MSKLSKSSSPAPKVSVKLGRDAVKRPAGNHVMATVRCNEIIKRGTPNPQKASTEKACSNEKEEKNCEENVDTVEKAVNFDVSVSPGLSDTNVDANAAANDHGVKKKEKPLKISDFQENEKAEAVIPPTALSVSQSGESLKSFQDEPQLLEDDMLAKESTVNDRNIFGTLEAYNFAPVKILVTDENQNVNMSQSKHDWETVITQFESEPPFCHIDSEKAVSAELEAPEGINTEEEIISSDLDLAISMIKAVHSQAIKAAASGLPDPRAKEIIDTVLTVAVSDLLKFSEKSNNKSTLSKDFSTKILVAVVSVISVVVVSLGLLSKSTEGFHLQPPPT